LAHRGGFKAARTRPRHQTRKRCSRPALAAYTDALYVDKRTHEDFRRFISKEPELARLLGAICKAKTFTEMAE
jgi:2-keto-4-pentenoate hydratase